MTTSNPIPRLELPVRWEKLKERSESAKIDVSSIVERVEGASRSIDRLLRRVKSNGTGQFSVVFGASGSGKTTFVSTLPKFFEGVRVLQFGRDKSLSDLRSFISSKVVPGDHKTTIVLITERDNPKPDELAHASELFSDLVDFFRLPAGQVLVLWSVTNHDAAKKIADYAWSSGSDSVADPATKAFLEFEGLEKQRYPFVADSTSQALTGDNLSAFGIGEEKAKELTADSETISMYLNKLNEEAERIRGDIWSVLKARTVPHLWVLVPGDRVKEVDATVKALTAGNRGAVDIALMQEFVDNAEENVQYVKEWRARRGQFSHLMRVLDVRIFALPPNVATAAVRTFGANSIKEKLKQPNMSSAVAKDSMRSTRLYKELCSELGIDASKYAGARSVKPDTEDEYRRIQRQANSDDKPLNKSLGGLLEACLVEDGYAGSISVEKKELGDTGLQPDIMIEIDAAISICIEPTWRSTGKGVDGEFEKRQATLTEAHIKKYVMDKALDYVKALGL